MAAGSANEMSVLLEYSRDLGYIGSQKYEKAAKEYDEIGKMLSSLIKKVAEGKSKI